MRTILIVYTLFLLLVRIGYSQDQYSFISEQNNWELTCYHLQDAMTYNVKIEFAGDTIIEDKTCKIVDDMYGNFIFCEQDKRIYVKRFQESQFRVMYDFNLQVADTFIYSLYYEFNDVFLDGYLVVMEVDTVQMLTGEYRKRIQLSSLGDTPPNSCASGALTWIDGIGDITNDPFYLFTDCFEGSCDVKCFSVDSTYIFGQCGPNSVEVFNNFNFRVYPNPFINSINITNIDAIDKAELVNLNGEIFKLTITKEDVLLPKHLNSGIYFLTLTSKKGKIKTVKLIKEYGH